MKKNTFLIVISLILIIVSIFFPLKVNNYEIVGMKSDGPIGKMKSETIYEQYFTTNKEDFNMIGIPFATYDQKNEHGKIKISLYKNGTLLKEKKYKLNDISDNSILNFKFKKQKNVYNQKYKLKIEFDKYYDDILLTGWYGMYLANENNYLMVNNKKMDRSLLYYINGKSSVNDFTICSLIFFSFIIMVISLKGDK